ncbi:PilN domain-containing protein [Pseudaeromonas sharmana]|uniref:PilN domain-containing protein n=1 Tax=Pseudaeromonas sharmana TaxID=328412 RepID=A0ABV8CKL8_9GAMM
MKYRINLYSEDLKPQRQWLSLLNFSLLWAGTLLVLLASGSVMALWLHQQEGIHRELSLSHNALQLERDRLQAELNQRRSDLGLQQRYEASQEELLSRQQLLEVLQGRAPLRSAGYAAVLEDLARVRVADIALERIQLQADMMSLQGAARSSPSVPAWVSRFSSAKSLSGRAFAELQLTRNPQGLLQFRLNSLPPEPPKAKGAKS